MYILLYNLLYQVVAIVACCHGLALGCWGHRSEKVNLRGLDYVAYKMFQYAVLL